MHVEFKDLTWAITTSQHRSIRQAATALNIRQSTLSRRLQDLEYRLGTTLFERSSSGTRPTIAGREFLKTASRIVTETETALSHLSAFRRGETGELSLGIYMALSAGNLRATLLDYRRRFPDVAIRVVDGTSTSLISDLSDSLLDIVILAGSCATWDDSTLSLWNERVVAALPDRHPFCEKKAIRWNELKAELLLINRRAPGPEFFRLFMAEVGYLEECHFTEHDIGMDRLLSLVGAGLGLTLVLEGATGATYPGVVFREVHDENGPTRLSFRACWRRANTNPALTSFLGLLRERYPDLLEKPFAAAP